MIYDCFSFFNELDLLEIRLNTLNNVVDRFVLVEAPWTHTGQPKPFYYQMNAKRYAKFADKIIHVIADDPPPLLGATPREIAWARENTQRNSIAKGLRGAHKDDIIIISDLDEIPRPSAILAAAKQVDGITNLELKNYAFFLNNKNLTEPNWTGGPQLIRYKTFCCRETYSNAQFNDCTPRHANQIPSATLIRFLPKDRSIHDAGWHFSSMGGIDTIITKLSAFAHTEYAYKAQAPDKILARIKNGKGLFFHGEHFSAEPLGTSFPPYILAHKDVLQHLILPTTPTRWLAVRLATIFYRLERFLYNKSVAVFILLTPKCLSKKLKSIRARLRI